MTIEQRFIIITKLEIFSKKIIVLSQLACGAVVRSDVIDGAYPHPRTNIPKKKVSVNGEAKT